MRTLAKRDYALAEGSVQDIAQREGISIEEAFLRAEYVVLLDVSYSMTLKDGRGGQTRHDVAEEELRKLQSKYPGKLALVCFSDTTVFVPSGVPDRLNGGTDMLSGMRFVQRVDGSVKLFFIVSDGQPNWGQEQECLDLAEQFKTPINTIFVGPEHDFNAIDLMRRLAKAGRGKNVNASEIGKLAEPFEILLLGAG